MKGFCFFLFIFCSACHTRAPVCLIDVADIIKGSPKKMITMKDGGTRISALYDEGWDSLKGGAYLFYPNEQLKSYTFYQSRVPVYTETYDELGYLTNTKGSPMVDRIINDMGSDSAFVQVYFFKPMKTYESLLIKINNGLSQNYKLATDTIYSNMKSVTFGINTSQMNNINMYSQIHYLDECTRTEHILNDSLFLIKDSHNGLAPASAR